ncbi:unnamed protein product [Adineta ricciae]|uniref:Annexin n=1 Tax=Adineta ricciae TaxID=249248 RepID=A0A814RPX6_ADIRI|nr:unnamed protein product [Adineta ricciae]
MALKRSTKNSDNHYGIDELGRPTTAPPYSSSTVRKYIGHRTIGINVANTYTGSLRNFALSTIGSTVKSTPVSTDHGLVALVETSYSHGSSSEIIDGERSIHEQRELFNITETLTDTILQCCYLEVYNRALEMQIEWLENNANKNSSTIEKMFRQETQTARELVEDASRYKPDMEKKLQDVHQATLSNDEYYQQLLSKRNSSNREIFDYHRQLAQTRAEAEFLRCRIQQFNDEIQFYTVKNESLQMRQAKLRYELDEEIFAKQVLQSEVEILKSEKISTEDAHAAATDEVRSSVDHHIQIGTSKSSAQYREQLIHHVRRGRAEYEKKIQAYRDELHRRYELELHRYHMCRSRPAPNVTREHEQKLDQVKRERKTVEQQVSSVRGSIQEIQHQIEILRKKLTEDDIEIRSRSSDRRHLTMLEQIIHDREEQLKSALHIRSELKQRIEKYRDELNRHSSRSSQDATITRKSILRSSSAHEIKTENYHSSNYIQLKSPSLQDIRHVVVAEGTLVRFNGFEVEQDCRQLNKILNESHVDEAAVIRILCNRSVAQRVQIRDVYKNLFHQNLIHVIESSITGNSKNILKILLLSAVERDCYELRRVLKNTHLDENILIELFLVNTNQHIRAILSCYNKFFESTVEQDLLAFPEIPSIRIFLALLQANRPEDDRVDQDEVLDDARYLAESQAKWRADGSTFVRLLCNRSNEHLKQTFAAYQRYTRVDIEDTIRMDVNTDLSRTLMAIVRFTRNQVRFFAYELKKSLKGLGTNENNLTRIIVSRCEIDMVQIKSEFDKIAHRTLFDHIQTDTKGNYKRALLELLHHRIEPISKEVPFPQLLNPSQKHRANVQWKDSVTKQASTSNVNYEKLRPFDRNNHAKRTTLSTIDTKLSQTHFTERRSSDEHHDED